MKALSITGSINAALAIILGAFGAHGLKHQLDEYALSVFNTAAEYQLSHALGMMLIGILVHQGIGNKIAKIAGWLMFTGILIFCGSLYLLALSNIRWLGAITPIGGLSLIVSWLLLAYAIYQD